MNATQILERTPEMLAVQAETRRHCDQFRITDPEEIERAAAYFAYRMWQTAVEPLQRMRTAAGVAALNFMPAQYILHEGGRLERVEVPFPKETTELMAQIDEMIMAEARRYGVRVER